MKRAADPDVKLLQAAADPTRLAILRQLSSEGSVCACDFTDCCAVHQPTVSHHLRVLREAGWVNAERHGTSIYYAIRPEAVDRFRQLAGGLTAGLVARPIAELETVAAPTLGVSLARNAPVTTDPALALPPIEPPSIQVEQTH